MQLTRRSLIKQFVFVSAGALLIPSCMDDKTKSAVLLKNFTLSGEQEKMLEELSSTIIPTTQTPGAKEAGAHLFALKMLDDCFKKEDRKRFLKGMQSFEQSAKEKFNATFIKLDDKQRSALLQGFEESKDEKNEGRFFYATVKRLTIQAYTSSQYYLTKVHVYELVPGRYHGCVPMNYDSKKNS